MELISLHVLRSLHLLFYLPDLSLYRNLWIIAEAS